MTITAKVIADSIGFKGTRITTFSLHYPRFIHSELMTHRVFSRNSSSSRAIPVAKMIEKILEDPAMPTYWGKNQSGMQASEEIKSESIALAKREWLKARDSAVLHVKALLDLGLHKQVANRPLEPFMHQDTVLTSTYWGNFYNLRDHKDAQPELKDLAQAMLEAHNKSDPAQLKPGEWHLPYIFDFEKKLMSIKELLVASTARCARVSYRNHEGKATTITEDLVTFTRLIGGQDRIDPKHASPAEHQAKYPESVDIQDNYVFPHLLGNFQNWVQHRKYVHGENMPVYEKLLPK